MLIGYGYSYAQSAEKIPVPVLKESSKIDRMMDIVFDTVKRSSDTDIELSKDSCFRIEVRNMNDYISFQIVQNRQFAVNSFLNSVELNKIQNIGYFNYRGYKIFVWTEDNFHSFFDQTSEVKLFDTIYRLKKNTPQLPYKLLFPNSFHYKYQNGQLSIESPPPVM